MTRFDVKRFSDHETIYTFVAPAFEDHALPIEIAFEIHHGRAYVQQRDEVELRARRAAASE